MHRVLYPWKFYLALPLCLILHHSPPHTHVLEPQKCSCQVPCADMYASTFLTVRTVRLGYLFFLMCLPHQLWIILQSPAQISAFLWSLLHSSFHIEIIGSSCLQTYMLHFLIKIFIMLHYAFNYFPLARRAGTRIYLS